MKIKFETNPRFSQIELKVGWIMTETEKKPIVIHFGSNCDCVEDEISAIKSLACYFLIVQTSPTIIGLF